MNFVKYSVNLSMTLDLVQQKVLVECNSASGWYVLHSAFLRIFTQCIL
jgi:hypothetical protein